VAHPGGRQPALRQRQRPAGVRQERRILAGYHGVGRNVTEQKRAETQLRESEARFRALAELSSDWYWEQDAEYRFTRLEGRNVAGHDSDLAARLIGQPRWGSELECEGGWRAHRALLDARQPFYNVLMWRKARDGNLRYVRISGEPVFNAAGGFTAYRGVGHEVTAEKRGELLLRLEHEAARALAMATDAAGGVRGVLRALCEAEGLPCGRYFAVDESAGEARFAQAWHVSDPDISASWRARARSSTGTARGSPAQRSAEPRWTSDVQAIEATALSSPRLPPSAACSRAAVARPGPRR
jgi:PAS domain-containing protein